MRLVLIIVFASATLMIGTLAVFLIVYTQAHRYTGRQTDSHTGRAPSSPPTERTGQ